MESIMHTILLMFVTTIKLSETRFEMNLLRKHSSQVYLSNAPVTLKYS